MTSAAMIAGMVPMALALRRRRRGDRAARPRGDRRPGRRDARHAVVLPSVYSLVQQSASAASPSLDPDDPDSAYRTQAGMTMTTLEDDHVAPRRSSLARCCCCSARPRAAAVTPPPARQAAAAGRRAGRRSTSCASSSNRSTSQLSLPGELTAYQSVAIYPRVTGFVKTVRVDRGSRVRAGDVLATLDAPELSRSGRKRNRSSRPRKRSWPARAREGRCRQEHLRQAESRVRHAGRGRRQRRARRREGGRRQPEPGRGRPAERRSRTPGAERHSRHGGLPAGDGAVRRRRHRAQRPSGRARRTGERAGAAAPHAAPRREQSAAPRRAGARGVHRGDEGGHGDSVLGRRVSRADLRPAPSRASRRRST